MNTYNVLVRSDGGVAEYTVSADSFVVDAGGFLTFIKGGVNVASFRHWTGVIQA